MKDRRSLRVGIWLATAGVVFVAGRFLAYALAPRPTLEAARLGQLTGGSRPLVLAVALLVAAALVAGGVLAVAAAAVRQRHLVQPGFSLRPAAPSVPRAAVAAVALWMLTSGAFAVVESRIHAAAGLHMSPLHCLVGPVHRDVLPLFAALSLLGAALVHAAEYLLTWLRRTLHVLRGAPRLAAAPPAAPVPPFFRLLRAAAAPRALGSRGPPALLRA